MRGLDHKFMKHSKMGVASQVGPLSTLMTQRESVGSMVVNSGLFYVSGGPSKSLMALGHNRIVRLESFYRNFLGFRNSQFILNHHAVFLSSHGKGSSELKRTLQRHFRGAKIFRHAFC